MTFNDYFELKNRAMDAGVAEDHPALKQLLHLIQAKQKAQEHFEAYLRDMNEREKNCAKAVEDATREAGKTGMAEVDWSKVAVDTPIFVKELENDYWCKRYFARYQDGKVRAWNNGKTSWSGTCTTAWNFAKLAEEVEDE